MDSNSSRLDGLLQHLSLAEIRRVRIQLSSSPICDICDLPLELIFRIFTHLSLEDILVLRGVSRKWKSSLSSTEFCLEMIKEHFRPYWEWSIKDVEPKAGVERKEFVVEWFKRAAIERVRREYGLYHSMAMFSHGIPQNEPLPRSYRHYSNGRLGWKVGDSRFQVKHLSSGFADKLYMDENRAPMERWLLSDKHLIGVKTGQ
jgi:hypothetical protein